MPESEREPSLCGSLERDGGKRIRSLWSTSSQDLTINQIPRWYLTNPSIVFGYRAIVPSVSLCLRSMLRMHNETGNIWTHMVGAIMIMVLLIHDNLRPPVANMTGIDFLLLNLNLGGFILCLTLSALFHLLSSYSKHVFHLFAKLDYTGITILIACSFVPWIYYNFYNSPIHRILYLGVAFTLGTICVIISMFDRFSEPRYRRVRAMIFMADGLSGLVPIFHWCMREIKYGEHPFYELDHTPTLLLVGMCLCYMIGALIYLFKIPEHFCVGRFDLWFNSHQLFHVMVIAGGLFYYHGLIKIMAIRLHNPHHFFN